MKIREVTYSQHEGRDSEWFLDGLVLGDINLIVGKNASGKTRTLKILNGLANLLLDNGNIKFGSGDYDISFIDTNDTYRYKLKYEEMKIVSEGLIKGTETLLERRANEAGRIWAEKKNEFLEFQIPDTLIAASSRRDLIQHSYFESFYNWANGVLYFPFGTKLGRETLGVQIPDGPAVNPKAVDNVVAIFKDGEKSFGEDFRKSILADMGKIGYDLEEIGLMPPKVIKVDRKFAGELVCLFVKERSLKGVTEQIETSQGMFRALALLINLNYAAKRGKPTTVLIDDIGEGLDFTRSATLIDIIIEKAKIGGFQVLMATNDRFVMNKVPIEFWSIVVRDGQKTRVFNQNNSQKRFDEFRFTGLNNFDLLATEYFVSPK